MINRRLTQLVSLILLHSSWGPQAKWFCNPVLSCHSCFLSWFACPIGIFVHYSGYHLFPFFALGTVLLIGALFGRLLCGWVCPFGFLQDLLYKVESPKFKLPRWTGAIKYVVLILTVFMIPYFFGEETMYSFCRVCPASALQITIPHILTAGFGDITFSVAVKLVVLVAILAATITSSRAFCRVLCPIGALLAPLNLLSAWIVKVPADSCLSCGKCDKACPTEVEPSARIKQGVSPNRTPDCIVCHECQKTCPQAKKIAKTI